MSETRALSAALSGPTFEGAATRSALHASERHVERWAPEGPTAARSRGLRSLAFADHVASPWMTASSMMHPRTAGMFGGANHERSAPGVSWVFPRPWFQDELDWMAAARQGAEASPQFLTTRGTYASARTSSADVTMPVVSPELVVPSMMAGAMSSAAAERRAAASPAGLVAGMAPAAASVQHGLRSWSPSVPFAAAAAAEVVAGAISAASSSGLTATAAAERSPILSGLAMVSPAAISGLAGPRAGQAAALAAALDASSSSIARVEQARRPDPIAPSLMATVGTSSAASLVESAISRAAESGTVTSADAGTAAPSVSAPSTVAPTVYSPSELAMSAAIGASPALAGALRAIDLLIHAASPTMSPAGRAAAADSTSSTGSSSTGSSSTGASSTGASSTGASSTGASSTGASSSSSFAAPSASPWASSPTFAPVVGPRVAMPAGLGGLAAALETAHTISQPLARTSPSIPFARAAAAGMSMAASSAAASSAAIGAESASAVEATRVAESTPGFRAFSPVWAQPKTALASVAGERARGVDHLAWSDRWLARFAGASPVALNALDVQRGEAATAPRQLAPNAPEIVYLHPELGPARLRAAIDASQRVAPIADRPAAPAPTPRPTGVLRIDDGEAVPDSVFAALFGAPAPTAPTPSARRAVEAAAPRAPVERGPVSMVDAVRGGSRPTVADLVSISAPTAPDAGLSAGLASSPMAAAMAGVIPLPQAPVFDPRALFAGGMATAYMGGLTARAAAPVGVLASAPTAGALASVARFGDLASAGGAMGGWALRDLALAPQAMRLAESAPERTMLATGGDLDIIVRGGGTLARGRDAGTQGRGTQAELPRWTSPSTPFRGLSAPDLELLASPSRPSTSASSAPSSSAPSSSAPSSSAPSSSAPSSTTVPAAAPTSADLTAEASIETAQVAAASARASLPAIEPELLALRSALLASPTASSAPLAPSVAPLRLSSAMAVPRTSFVADAGDAADAAVQAATPSTSAARATAADAPMAAAARAAAAMPLLTLPSVGGSAPSPVATAMAGHATGAANELQASPASSASRRPGDFAEQALRWSVAEERSAAGLSFDFVSPEMVLAAKVYGLSPAAAVEASRLAIAGPSALASLATSLDLTFLRSFQQSSSAPAARAATAPGVVGATPSTPAGTAPFASMIGAQPLLPPALRELAAPAAAAAQAELIAAASPTATSPTATSSSTASSSAASSISSSSPAADLAPTSVTAAAADAVAAFSSPASLSMAGWDVSGTGARASESGWTAGAPTAAPGMPSRMPRGAFLWPPGAVSALGLRAQALDGVAGLPVVALELLAAQAVADLGTWVTAHPAFAGADQAALATALRAAGITPGAGLTAASAAASSAASPAGASPAGAASSSAGAADALSGFAGPMGAAGADMPFIAGAAPGATGQARAAGGLTGATTAAETAALSAEAEAISAPVDESSWRQVEPTSSPQALRARFEAIYIALARTPEGVSLSPSARAARAMAVIAGSQSGSMSPRARAAAVWSVMPQVFEGGLEMVAPAARGDGSADTASTEWGGPARPGLAGLASRAGEALGSFVAPHGNELATASGRSTESTLAQRVDNPIYVDTARPGAAAAQEQQGPSAKRPGRAFSQVGGGEPEIPAWFESAARKMLEDGSGGGGSAGMTLAEMVLVTAMPQKQIAASTKGANASMGRPGAKDHDKGAAKKPDVHALAQEVYAEVMKLIESARERSGDPYQ